MNYPKLKQIATEKGVSIKDLAAFCNMTDAGFHKAIREDTMRVSVVEKCAEKLGVSVCVFFDCLEEESKPGANDTKYYKLLERHNEVLEENISLRSQLRKYQS